jgi:polysaccharide export outer membrane protein
MSVGGTWAPSRGITGGLFLAGLAVMMGAAGCQCAKPEPAPPDFQALLQPAEQATDIPTKQIVLPTYRLNVGDQLEVIYHVKHTITREGYRVKIEDTLEVRFPFQPQYDQTAVVSSDGTVHLLLVGRVPVFEPSQDGNPEHDVGKTADEIQTDLKRRYSQYIKSPELTVRISRANIKIEELKRAITTAPRGQSRLVPVNPDGTLDLPYIGTVTAFGKTIAELRQEINDAYAKADLEEIDVTVQMNTWASQKVFVLGEVNAPGMVTSATPISLVQAIASAGGASIRGDQKKVLVVRRKGVPVPQGAVVNVEHLLTAMKGTKHGRVPDFSQFKNDIWLQDMDIVYVPMTGLAAVDDWIDQVFTRGIRAVVPYTFYTGVNFGYDLHNEPSTVKTRSSSTPNVNIGLGP